MSNRAEQPVKPVASQPVNQYRQSLQAAFSALPRTVFLDPSLFYGSS